MQKVTSIMNSRTKTPSEGSATFPYSYDSNNFALAVVVWRTDIYWAGRKQYSSSTS